MNQSQTSTHDDLVITQGISAKAIFEVLSPLLQSPDVLSFNGEPYDASMADHEYQLIKNATRSAQNVYLDSPASGGTTWVLRTGQDSLSQQAVREAYQLSVVSVVTTPGLSASAILAALSKLIRAPSVLTFDGKPYDASLATKEYARLEVDGRTFGYVEAPDQTTTWLSQDEQEPLEETDVSSASSIDVQSCATQ